MKKEIYKLLAAGALLALTGLVTSCESMSVKDSNNVNTGTFASTGFTSNVQYGEEISVNEELPIVILKLDDLRVNMGMFPDVADYVIENEIKAAFGINGREFVNLGLRNPYVSKVIEWHYGGWIEIWHHGWDHSKAQDRKWFEYQDRQLDDRPEYADITEKENYGRQYRDFANTQNIVKAKCGITMHSFGSPYNKNDQVLLKILNQFPDIKTVMFSRMPLVRQINLDISLDRLNIEKGTGNVEASYFEDNYNDFNMRNDVMVLQAHPAYFDLHAYKQFTRIIDFLKEEGHTFMTPYEYYLYQKEDKVPRKGGAKPD